MYLRDSVAGIRKKRPNFWLQGGKTRSSDPVVFNQGFFLPQEYLLMPEDILTLVSETGNVSLYKYKYTIKVYLSLKLILTFSHLRPWEIIRLYGWNPPASAPFLYERPDQLWWHTPVTPGPQETQMEEQQVSRPAWLNQQDLFSKFMR